MDQEPHLERVLTFAFEEIANLAYPSSLCLPTLSFYIELKMTNCGNLINEVES